MTLGKCYVRFESTTQTEAFVSALKHLATAKPNSQPRNSDFFHGGRLDFIALSMQELINDYIWDPLVIKDGISPHSIDNNHSNLCRLLIRQTWANESSHLTRAFCKVILVYTRFLVLDVNYTFENAGGARQPILVSYRFENAWTGARQQ